MISVMEFVSICGVATMTAAGATRGLHLLRRCRSHEPVAPDGSQPEGCSGRPAPGTWHEPRDGTRQRVSCQIEYVVGDVQYEGRLVDMSKRGWRAQGLCELRTGTAMQVRILCSHPPQWITIEEAVVRWTDGLQFGLEVTRIGLESAAKLSDYLATHDPAPVPAPAYAL